MSRINFDEIINRRNTPSTKWTNAFDGKPLRDNQIPMWVADMDFKVAPEIIESLKEAIDFGVFGYFDYTGYAEIVAEWCKRRYNWNVDKSFICFTQGLVQGFSLAIKTLAQVGESVLLLTPTYYPMFAAIKSQGCQVVESNLLLDSNGHYSIDYEDVERKVKDKNLTVALIGNPHNPVGRLYTLDEMKKLADILIKNNVSIICDDIHCDLIIDKTKKYEPLSSIDKYKEYVITLNAPSKTFNLAGMKVSNVIIPNAHVRRAYELNMESIRVSTSLLSLIACKTAYSKCEYWLEEVKEYIWNNYLYVKDFIEKSNLKGYIKPIPLEGSYLVFLDNRLLMKEFGMNENTLKNFYADTCNLSLDDGGAFGKAGVGFMRLNLATQRYFVNIAMDNLSKGFATLKK